MQTQQAESNAYQQAMGQLLVLYTQVDQLIMEVCAERIATAPQQAAKLGLAKQVGDESKHVSIQRDWMRQFGVSAVELITAEQQARIRAYFRNLSWLDFLADLYLCVEALGSEAVEKIVPLADPGTRESLRIPLSDELDHVAFGLVHLREALQALSPEQRRAYLARLPARIDRLTQEFHALGLNVPNLFNAVGADYAHLCEHLLARRTQLIDGLAA